MDSATAPVDFLDVVFRLSLAVFLGAIIGFDRELRRKPAGLRTHALVGLGCAVCMLFGMSLVANDRAGDAASRVAQGILAGIGFIGGGVILRDTDRRTIEGLTTAAMIWLVAAIGICAGAGLWRIATLTVALALGLLMLGGPIERVLARVRPEDTERSQ